MWRDVSKEEQKLWALVSDAIGQVSALPLRRASFALSPHHSSCVGQGEFGNHSGYWEPFWVSKITPCLLLLGFAYTFNLKTNPSKHILEET